MSTWTVGLGGRWGLSSRSSGVARCRNFSAHCACHFTIMGSGTSGKASIGRSGGNLSPVSGCSISNFRTAYCMNGTCSSGPSSISIDCQFTYPRIVNAGTDGGLKTFSSGCRVCWQPMLAYIQDIEGYGTSTNRAIVTHRLASLVGLRSRIDGRTIVVPSDSLVEFG